MPPQFVLFHEKSGGAIPVSGNNIQLYTAGGYPEAQEWLFVPLGNNQYKIVLRSNMNLCIAGTSSNDVVLQTYSGSSLQKWTMQFMGCKPYYSISSGSSESNTVNCQGYAFLTLDNPQNWLNYTAAQKDAWTDVNTALANTKSRLEANWLNVYFPGKWEDVTSQGGMNAQLASNQWLVAMRVGIGDFFRNGSNVIYSPSSSVQIINKDGVYYTKYITYDYHFWYRDNTGQWTNKHGTDGTPSQPLGTDIPTTNNSPGWACGIDNYYNSNIVYYRITE